MPRLEGTELTLERVMSMRAVGSYPDPETPEFTVDRHEMGACGLYAQLHVAVVRISLAQFGARGVHHVAFRTPSYEQYQAWAELLMRAGVSNSGPIDRYYFKSLYFREPGGVLFEIATDRPGFDDDEDAPPP